MVLYAVTAKILSLFTWESSNLRNRKRGNDKVYTRDKLVKVLKIKNVIFTVLGIFNIIISVYCIISLVVYYREQLETVLHAKSTPESIVRFIVGMILVILSYISRRLIGDANFYSSYFEGDLDGYVKYSDLAEVTGKSEGTIKWQLHFFRKIYMKNYEIKIIDDVEQVVLDSKKCLCECRNCGAPIEKRIYFTGVCSYCGSSDLFARVLMDNRFYSITNNMSKGMKKPEFYVSKHLKTKKWLFLLYLCLGLSILCLITMVCLNSISNYNDKEYLIEVLLSGKSYSSFSLIKAEIMDTIVLCLVLILALIFVVRNRFQKIKCVFTADTCSKHFSESKTPFVRVETLPAFKHKLNKKRVMKSVRGAIRRRYLINCTLEKHDGALKVALAKKIVKDECPSCGGSIVGAVDEHYQCRYCGNIIMEVVRKKVE